MRLYLLLGILFLLVIWDIGQNQGQYVRDVGAGFAGILRAVGLM